MAKKALVIEGMPEKVQILLREVRDEFSWLVEEFKTLLESDDYEEFGEVLDTVMEYTEDFHAALEELETLVNK